MEDNWEMRWEQWMFQQDFYPILVTLKEFDGKGWCIAITRCKKRGVGVREQWIVLAELESESREAANGMRWNDFKAFLVEEFCPSNEMEKLENEFWNHSMVGANHVAYNTLLHL
ncbi:hypothetical protein Tco_0837420 [Tanacetum coccineum]